MQGDDYSGAYGKKQHKAIKSSGAVAAGIGELARQHEQGGAPIQETRDARGTGAMENTKSSKISMRDILGILAIILSIVVPIFLSILGFSAQLNSRIDSLSAETNSRFDSINTQIADLRVVDTEIDNKLNTIGQMIILAHGNGEITEAELVSIWESVGAE